MALHRIATEYSPLRRRGATGLALAAAFFVTGTGCLHTGASGPASMPTAEVAKAAEAGAPALAQIDRLIGQARCTADEQCRVAELGSRACGGPESFRAWSTQTSSAAALNQQLLAYATARQRWREKAGLMSTCEVLPTPAARCEAASSPTGRCVLVLPATNLLR